MRLNVYPQVRQMNSRHGRPARALLGRLTVMALFMLAGAASAQQGHGENFIKPLGTDWSVDQDVAAVVAENDRTMLRLTGSKTVSASWNIRLSKNAVPDQRLGVDVRLHSRAGEDAPLANRVVGVISYETTNKWWPVARVRLSMDYGTPHASLIVRRHAGKKNRYKTLSLPGVDKIQPDAWVRVELDADFAQRRIRGRLRFPDAPPEAWTDWIPLADMNPTGIRLDANGTVDFDHLRLVAAPEQNGSPAARPQARKTYRPIPACVIPAAHGVKAWRVSPHFKIYPDDSFNTNIPQTPPLRLSRGEYEPFQIALQPDKPLADVRVELNNPLPDNVSITFQPQGLVDIQKSSIRTGPTPDPLLNEPKIDVPAGENRAFWITLHAARDAAPEPFDLQLKLTSGEKTLATITQPVQLWDFPMPQKPHLACMVEYRPWNHDGHYEGFRGWPLEKQYKLHHAYYQWYARHRIQPGTIFPQFRVEKGEDGQWRIANAEAVKTTYPKYMKEFPGAFQVTWLRNGMIGHGSSFKPLEQQKERLESIQQSWKLFLDLCEQQGWSIESLVWYVCDEPVMPRYDNHARNVPIINEWVKAIRPYTGRVPTFGSVWPFVREIIPSIDIYSMRPYGDPRSRIERMPLKEARALGKAVALTLDGSENLCTDREAINHRMDPWHGWYAGVPMIEYWNNIWWQMNPWTPKPNWFSAKWIYPGDGNLNYPPRRTPPSPAGEVVTSIRAENLREGMEDYEYLWLLRHGADVIRQTGQAGKEYDLLARAELALWDAQQWIARGGRKRDASDYLMLTLSFPPKRTTWLANKFDELRTSMGEIIQELYRKGYLKEAAIDTGHKPPLDWLE